MLHPLQLKEVSVRYPGEIAELRDFLGKTGVPVETPGAIASVAAGLRQDPAFRRDLTLHMWAVSNAPGQQVGYPDTMAMLAVAAAGSTFAAEAGEADTRELLRFVMEARSSFDTGAPVDRHPPARVPAALAAAPPLSMRRSAESHHESVVDSDDESLLTFATEDDTSRRRLLVGAAAVCALLLLCFGLWLHSRPSGTSNATATISPAPVNPPVAQPPVAPVEPAPSAPRMVHRTPPASVPATPSENPHSRTRVPATPAAAPLRDAAPSHSVASKVPAAASPAPARTQPKIPATLGGVPPKTDVYLGTAVPAATKAPRNDTKAARSDTPVVRSSSSDAPIVELYTPVVRPTTLGNMASHLTYGPAPQYPAAAVDQHVQGQVTLEAEVDTTGNVISTRVVSGPPLLQEAAMNAVHSWQYRPYLYDGKPIAVNATVVMDFQLR